MSYNFDLGKSPAKQLASVEILLSKIPNAAEIKAFISENDPDEKMLDEWLWEKIHKWVDYKQMHRKEIEECGRVMYNNGVIDSGLAPSDYYTQTYG